MLKDVLLDMLWT